MSEWKPIESAPKDGTWVLLYGDDYNEPIRIRHWRRGVVGNRREVDAWWSSWETYSLQYEPTHWMPLPPPPQKETRDE